MPATASESWRKAPERLPVNRVAPCLEESVYEEAPLPKWMAVHEEGEPERGQPYLWLARFRSSPVAPHRRGQDDPVTAALRVLEGPEDTLRRTILNETIEAKIATVGQLLSERLNHLVEDRVDAVLKERAEAHLRASVLVQDFISQLREKAAGVPLLPPEEAWKHVDFSAVYDEEEEGEE